MFDDSIASRAWGQHKNAPLEYRPRQLCARPSHQGGGAGWVSEFVGCMPVRIAFLISTDGFINPKLLHPCKGPLPPQRGSNYPTRPLHSWLRNYHRFGRCFSTSFSGNVGSCALPTKKESRCTSQGTQLPLALSGLQKKSHSIGLSELVASFRHRRTPAD
jgi:hypothetical protein